MGEPERREELDRPLEGGALPEGAATPAGPAADPARRDRLPPLHSRQDSADDLAKSLEDPNAPLSESLDLLIKLNEPELLIRALKKIAVQYPPEDKRWLGILRLCERCEEYYDHIGQPRSNRPQP
jgi:hypothetical protein